MFISSENLVPFINFLVNISWLFTGWALIYVGYSETEQALRFVQFMLFLSISAGLSGFKVVVERYLAKKAGTHGSVAPAGFNAEQNSQPEIIAKTR